MFNDKRTFDSGSIDMNPQPCHYSYFICVIVVEKQAKRNENRLSFPIWEKETKSNNLDKIWMYMYINLELMGQNLEQTKFYK